MAINKFLIIVLGFWIYLSVIANADDNQKKHLSGEYDYLVFSLSWSPQFCSEGNNKIRNPKQCDLASSTEEYFSSGFVVHGLWPQFKNGGYPSFCPSKKVDLDLLVKNYRQLFPSKKLLLYQWKKHGKCFGENHDLYFEAIGKIKSQINSIIPKRYIEPDQTFNDNIQDLKMSLIENANSNHLSLELDNLAIYCSRNGRFLREVRICFDKKLKPVKCDRKLLKKSKKSCYRTSFLVKVFDY